LWPPHVLRQEVRHAAADPARNTPQYLQRWILASVLDLAQHAWIDTSPFSHLFLVQAGRLPHLLDEQK
jgi:hypothetical protein